MVTKWQTGQLNFNNLCGRGDRVGRRQTNRSSVFAMDKASLNLNIDGGRPARIVHFGSILYYLVSLVLIFTTLLECVMYSL